MKAAHPASIKTVIRSSLAAVGFLLGGVIVGFGLSQEFTGQLTPGAYTVPTLARARQEVAILQRTLNSGQYSPVEIQQRIMAVAADNKPGVQVNTPGAENLTVQDATPGAIVFDPSALTNTVSLVPQGSSVDHSLDGLPDVPSVGYTVGDYTYAGFEPKSINRNLTETDVAKGGKDFVYRYLINNKIIPSNNWAPAAAAALNKEYNTTVFVATDGETLSYGDEYVHSAPNGYGLVTDQYDAAAKGEFFWGYE